MTDYCQWCEGATCQECIVDQCYLCEKNIALHSEFFTCYDCGVSYCSDCSVNAMVLCHHCVRMICLYCLQEGHEAQEWWLGRERGVELW